MRFNILYGSFYGRNILNVHFIDEYHISQLTGLVKMIQNGGIAVGQKTNCTVSVNTL